MRGTIFIALGAFAAASCSAEQPAVANQGDTAPTVTAAPAPAREGKPVELKSDTRLLSWQVSWPAEVNAIPALEKLIRDPAEKAREEYTRTAREDEARRKKEGFDFNAYEYSDSVDVVGQTPRLLSLARQHTEYSGGAHPNHGTDGILWDKEAGASVTVAGLLTDGGALDRLYRDAYCKALNAERAVRRQGEDARISAEDTFGQCPKFSELQIMPTGPAKGGPMTALVFHADPYVAGPYVEGDYDVDLPVSTAFLAALKPAYRTSFAAR